LNSWDLLGLTLNPRDLDSLNRLNTDKGRETERRKKWFKKMMERKFIGEVTFPVFQKEKEKALLY